MSRSSAARSSNHAAKEQTDRRKAQRFDTVLDVSIKFVQDGTPIEGAASEIGPNGMRLLTSLPLIEAAYVHVSFLSASNNTHCEGRVVWTQRAKQPNMYESGIDIQRWGGDSPEQPELSKHAKPKKDRRQKPRQ